MNSKFCCKVWTCNVLKSFRKKLEHRLNHASSPEGKKTYLNQDDVVIRKSRISLSQDFALVFGVLGNVVAYQLPVYASCLRMIHYNCVRPF